MSLFGFGKKQQEAPPHPAPFAIRDTLFGDRPLDQWPRAAATADVQHLFPWTAFLSAREALGAGDKSSAIAAWREIAAHPGLEPRHYAQAWYFLRAHGEQPPQEIIKNVLGVVIEVGMPKGLDIIAAYPDHAARYYNFSGSGVVWERPDHSLDTPIDQLLAAAQQVVNKIGPWDKPRPAAPANGQIRISFLTPSGLHFGQGAMNVLSKDPLGSQVIKQGYLLMQALMAKAQKS